MNTNVGARITSVTSGTNPWRGSPAINSMAAAAINVATNQATIVKAMFLRSRIQIHVLGASISNSISNPVVSLPFFCFFA